MRALYISEELLSIATSKRTCMKQMNATPLVYKINVKSEMLDINIVEWRAF